MDLKKINRIQCLRAYVTAKRRRTIAATAAVRIHRKPFWNRAIAMIENINNNKIKIKNSRGLIGKEITDTLD